MQVRTAILHGHVAAPVTVHRSPGGFSLPALAERWRLKAKIETAATVVGRQPQGEITFSPSLDTIVSERTEDSISLAVAVLALVDDVPSCWRNVIWYGALDDSGAVKYARGALAALQAYSKPPYALSHTLAANTDSCIRAASVFPYLSCFPVPHLRVALENNPPQSHRENFAGYVPTCMPEDPPALAFVLAAASGMGVTLRSHQDCDIQSLLRSHQDCDIQSLLRALAGLFGPVSTPEWQDIATAYEAYSCLPRWPYGHLRDRHRPVQEVFTVEEGSLQQSLATAAHGIVCLEDLHRYTQEDARRVSMAIATTHPGPNLVVAILEPERPCSMGVRRALWDHTPLQIRLGADWVSSIQQALQWAPAVVQVRALNVPRGWDFHTRLNQAYRDLQNVCQTEVIGGPPAPSYLLDPRL